MGSILWYDLETFGLESRHDRIAQFACLRTDEQLNPLSGGLTLYNKITPDYLPSPYSCLVHRISPQHTLAEGLPEYQFARAILDEMGQPGTCSAGYNSVKFDDEFIRNLLYRNLFDPYEREWADGNSRWDVINLFRAARDLRPEGLSWPNGADGKPDFKLGSLAAANAVDLTHAHDALADIEATVALARLVKERQGRLYDWYWRHRTRDSLRPLVDLAGHEPLVHTAAEYTSTRGCSAIVAPVGMIPGRRDALVVMDLRQDPAPVLDLSVDELKRRVFARSGELPEGQRVSLGVVKLSKCPYLAPLSILDRAAEERLGLDSGLARQRAAEFARQPGCIQKLAAVFAPRGPEFAEADADYKIYSGGFFRDEDRDAMAAIHEAIATQGPAAARAQAYAQHFLDERLPQMVRRLFARNWPDTLSAKEAARWRSFCAGRLLCPRIEGATDLAAFDKTVATLMASMETPPEDKLMLHTLLDYRQGLERDVLSMDTATNPGSAWGALAPGLPRD
ncbi:MAG: exodeoxyribonuclease I [Spirochaetales bacterium]|nr:exodeoxyribonuclease I [Spirochaetales bacterium]